jgi:hypothetical protein
LILAIAARAASAAFAVFGGLTSLVANIFPGYWKISFKGFRFCIKGGHGKDPKGDKEKDKDK